MLCDQRGSSALRTARAGVPRWRLEAGGTVGVLFSAYESCHDANRFLRSPRLVVNSVGDAVSLVDQARRALPVATAHCGGHGSQRLRPGAPIGDPPSDVLGTQEAIGPLQVVPVAIPRGHRFRHYRPLHRITQNPAPAVSPVPARASPVPQLQRAREAGHRIRARPAGQAAFEIAYRAHAQTGALDHVLPGQPTRHISCLR